MCGDLEGIEAYLYEVENLDEYGRTALMEAAMEGNANLIPLLENEIGMQDEDGWTALIWAAVRGHANCIPLLEKEIGMQDNQGLTALMRAVEENHIDCVHLLLSEVGKQTTEEWKFTSARNRVTFHPGTTALMMAAWMNHVDCIPLLEREVGMEDDDGRTALMYAARSGQVDSVRLLLSEAGKQTTEEWWVFPSGTTALMLAAYFNHSEIVRVLLPYEQGIEDFEGRTAEWYAYNSSWIGDFTRVRKLLENEGTERLPPPNRELASQEHINDLTTENESLKNDLSSSKNTLEETKKELSQLNQENSSLKQHLQKANRDPSRAHTDSEDLKRELADQKARILALERENARLREESLISSAIRGDIEGIRRRLSQVKWHDASGMTALMHAASRGQTEVVRLLRPLEARLQDGRGWTALMHAVGGGHEECVGLLLLERDLRDREGRTAAEHAVDEKMRQVLMHQPSFPRLPDSLSGYHLTAVLGKGAFGAVYTAHGNGQNVAVKVIDLGKYNEKGRELLRREAEILLSLDHPNILQCLGTGENDDDDTYIIVTELCCGDLRGEMKERKKTGRSYTNQEVWKMVREMAAALVYLHRKRHVHRDLKPENIFITSNGRCVLGDFGLTKVLEDSSQMGTCVGTLAYMAPEIHRKESYDKSVDVWALGVAAYEMCTGDRPFKDPAVILEKKPAPPLRGRPSELADLIAWMLSKNPKDRPTAMDVIEEVERHEQAD